MVPHANITNNTLLLCGLTILIAFFGLRINQKKKRSLFESYQKVARTQRPIFVDDNEKWEVLDQVREQKVWRTLGLGTVLLLAIGAGYTFLTTLNMSSLMLSPLCAGILFMFIPNGDWLNGVRLAKKMKREIESGWGR